MTISQFFGKIHFLLPLLLLAACTGVPKDDGSAPAPLFLQPKAIEANPEGGYKVNPVTGDSIKPLINSFGDTVLTGILIPANPKLIHPDSVATPKSFVVNHAELTTKNAHPNRHVIPENLPTFPVDPSQLKTVKFGEGNQNFVLTNSTGDTIPTSVPIPTMGKIVKTIQPPPTKALTPVFKDGATTNLQYLDVDQGMSSSIVLSVLEDKNGNLWFGTFGGGVSMYNGDTFTHYTEKEGLSNNRVWSMLEDNNGNLWFGTNGGGVSMYNGETFTHYTEKEGLSNDRVYSILEDSNGNLWFGTDGGGVSLYNGDTFIHYTEKEGLSNNTVRSILEDNNGNIWFGTIGGGVSMYNGDTFIHYTEKEGLSNNFVYSILEDNNGNIWFGTNGGGVSMYNGDTFIHYTEKEGLSNNTVWSILEDNSGSLWFGTGGGGVSMYKGDTFIHYTEKEGLSNDRVYSMLEDNNGNLWFGTGGGVSMYNGDTFIHYTEKEGLSNDRVYSMLEDNNGNLWFGTGGGVSMYNGDTFIHYTEKEGLSNNFVLSMLEDENGNLWFGTNGGGVSMYNGETFTHYAEKEGLSTKYVPSILEDSNGDLWFGTSGRGVSMYNGETFTHYTEREGLSNNRVRSILEDKNGNLWFGTFGGGVSMYNGDTFTHYTEKEGLSNNTVRSILEDDNGNLYVSTERGLTQISSPHISTDGGKEVFDIQVFMKQDGLKGLLFYNNSAFIDSHNQAWWGSDKSLTMLDLNKFQTSTQIPQPSLKQLDINEQFIDYRNISDSPNNNQEFDKVTFNEVQKFENYPLNLELPFDKNHLTFHFAAIDWNAPHKIRYSHRMLGLNDNWNIPSKEAKADYRNLSHGTYTFQIRAIGESGEWSEPYEYTFAVNPPWWKSWWAYTFYALIFLVTLRTFSIWRERKLKLEKVKLEETVEERTKELKASQAQLVQQEKLASLGQLTAGIAHEIKNPLNFVNNFSELSVELVEEAREELRQRTGDGGPEDETANVKNESPSPGGEGQGDGEQGSEINLLLDILNDIETNLKTIHKHGSRADSIVKSMLQHSRGGDGKMEPTALNPLIKEYVNLAFHGMRAGNDPINVDIDLRLDDEVGEVPLVAEDFSRVILNLVNNAFDAMRSLGAERSANGESYSPKLTVSTKSENGQILIEVQDNGPGIPEEMKDKILQPFFTTKKGTEGTGLGLSITNDIIKAHGGDLEIRSEPNVGTTFIIKLTK